MNKKGQLIVVSGQGNGTQGVSGKPRSDRLFGIGNNPFSKTGRGTWRSLFLFKPRRV